MGYNIYQGQIIGPFSAGQNLSKLMKDNSIDTSAEAFKLWHLGIQSEVGAKFNLANKTIIIGKTGIYEIGNLDINFNNFSFYPFQALPASTIIDYVITVPE